MVQAYPVADRCRLEIIRDVRIGTDGIFVIMCVEVQFISKESNPVSSYCLSIHGLLPLLTTHEFWRMVTRPLGLQKLTLQQLVYNHDSELIFAFLQPRYYSPKIHDPDALE